MAVIRLGRYTGEEDDLPDVCMKCGAPATLRKRKQLSWYPRWVYFLLLVHILVFAIVALATTKRRTVSAPLCDEHKNHWMWRQLVVFLGFAAVVILIVAAAIISSEA